MRLWKKARWGTGASLGLHWGFTGASLRLVQGSPSLGTPRLFRLRVAWIVCTRTDGLNCACPYLLDGLQMRKSASHATHEVQSEGTKSDRLSNDGIQQVQIPGELMRQRMLRESLFQGFAQSGQGHEPGSGKGKTPKKGALVSFRCSSHRSNRDWRLFAFF
ncbi:hypothetical protein B0T10DRAFT_571145 [Thelonectria olida]|uniref:Uncharacterized protein n=1 Tax=Thelonectria olida TaxID=1576542 RepID=A0A9P8WIC5_9HYPO|nr:hypothetical protein B0T10DRAFT_571145 [Thelonectria olida]